MFDKELRREQVQGIRNADGVVGLFAELGYQTEARVVQSPDALGITADSAVAHIKKIERVADQEGLLQVYLFELASLTQALTQTIVRAFRNRVGQYLLVLTSGYDRLDFVLIERLLPPTKTEGLVPRQVTLRPRIVSIERQNPTRVHMRLLRRLTYTESDPGYQFEKLRSAFDMAEWSEEFFNNRGLFSDYYLKERLPESEAWKDDPKPTYKHLRELLTKAGERWAGKSKTAIVKELVQPALHLLGFSAAISKEPTKNGLRPDLLLSSNGSDKTPVALCLIYPWARWLDGKDDQREAETPEDNPGARVVSLLEEGRAPWAILTNGKVWRLYSSKTHSRATNYYEIDLEETLAQSGHRGEDAAEAFRYFWLLFRGKAFEGCPSFLDDILSGSEAYAKKLGDRLKGRIFEEIFPVFAEGFIENIRRQNGGHVDLPQPMLDQVFQGTLTFLYRLLFILYAEARDLLPVREYHGYGQKSLKAIKEEIAAKGCDLLDQRDEKLGKGYMSTDNALYRRIENLCAVIDKGDKALNLPMYNGGLFMTDPANEEDSPEAANARFLRDHAIPDRWLARGLDRLARDQDEKSFKLVFIDYKSLGVRHLGSIYEGLLEFKLRVAPEKMAIVQGKKTEEIVPYKEAVKEKRKILKTGRGKDAAERIKKTGELYLENDRRERKATGSYYTPDYIVQYIVEHAVGPVLEEKCSALGPKLRDAQKALKKEREKAMALRGMGGRHDDPEHEAYLKHRQVVDDLFDVKVLDPAMGSGHFLVETVDFITDKMLHFLNGFPWNPVLVHLKETRETILAEMEKHGITINTARLSDVNLLKRHILKRCIYGVDLNPMAVELAKVSLWLDCFTLGAPLSFLDHHLKCGNSLIGATVDEVDKALETQDKPSLFHTSEFARELVAVDLMRRIGELSDVTPEQVRESRQEFKKAMSALIPAKTVMDIYVSRWFGNEPKPKTEGMGQTLRKKKDLHDYALEFLRTDVCNQWLTRDPGNVGTLEGLDRDIAATALKAVKDKRFFHWEIEFPEVFFAPRKGTMMVVEPKPDAGFDAVVGNPPYVRQEELGEDKPFYEVAHAPVYSGVADLYVYFYHRGLTLCRTGGYFGMITSNKFLRAGYAKALRNFLSRYAMTDLIDFRDLPLFPDATAYPLVCIARQSSPQPDHRVRTYTVESMDEAEHIQETMERKAPSIGLTALREEGWTFQRPEVLQLLKKIRAAGKPLGEVVDGKFYRAILTGYNEAFVIDEAKRAELVAEDPKSAEIIKPFLRGRDIRRWRVEWAGLYLIFTRRGIDINRYPAIKAHLLPMKQRLMPGVPGGRKPGTYKWYEIQDSIDYYAEFEKPKIVYPDIYEHQSFSYDTSGSLLANTLYFIPEGSKSVVALLNSRLVEFYYRQTSAQVRGGYMRAFSTYIGQIPLVSSRSDFNVQLEKHVDAILATPDNQLTVAQHEQAINEIVYNLYGLTKEEIAIVEGAPVVSASGSCENANHEDASSPSRYERAGRQATPVAKTARRPGKAGDSLSEEDPGLGRPVHGVRERTRQYGPPEDPSERTEDDAGQVSSTRYFETSEGTLSYTQVSERVAVALAGILNRIVESPPDALSITPEWLCSQHRDLAGQLFPEWAGRYRDRAVQVGKHTPPPFYEIPVLVRLFCDDLTERLRYSGGRALEGIAELLAWADWRFQWIHPFRDFNGRIGRVLLVALIHQIGLPAVDTASTDPAGRCQYLQALQAADNGDLGPLTELWIQRIAKAL